MVSKRQKNSQRKNLLKSSIVNITQFCRQDIVDTERYSQKHVIMCVNEFRKILVLCCSHYIVKWSTGEDSIVGVWTQTSRWKVQIQLLIGRIEKQQFLVFHSAAIYMTAPRLFWPAQTGDGWGRAALCGSQWFKSPSPTKTISPISLSAPTRPV